MDSNPKQLRQLLSTPPDEDKFVEELAKAVSLGDVEKVGLRLNMLKKKGKLKLLSVYRENGGESMLHIAAKCNRGSEIIESLIEICPELLKAERTESEDHYGQTALHIAIAKGNKAGVKTMLLKNLHHRQTAIAKSAVLHQLATGTKFINTVMMGELPLSVAALTFNQDMIRILIEYDAVIDRQNSKGDTVIHSLIRFAAIYPEQLNDVLKTLEFFNRIIMRDNNEKCDTKASDANMEYDHSECSYIWFMPNNEALNALQLSASLSQPAIFKYILNLPKVYCFLNNHDGLFDQNSYDVTEIDTIATEKWVKDQKSRQHRLQRHIAPKHAEGVSRHRFSNKSIAHSPLEMCRPETRKSVLEIMFDIKSSAAFDIIQISTVRQIIKTKWIYYRRLYYGWMLFHLLFMMILTVYSVLRADNHSAPASPASVHFLSIFSYIYLVIGILYFCMEIYHLLFRLKSFELGQLSNVLHNGSYRIILLLFSVCLISEFILSHALEDYENYTLILALIAGWWFSVFFLRAQKKFSFFTVMIQKVIVGDMLRFSIIITLTLVSFTAGIYMTFRGSGVVDDDLQSYGRTMMLLFKLMLGLGEFEKLYEARRPWLAVTLFIWFVLLTYVLMFNALIAMMSQTCTLVSEDRNVQWRVQQLSVIIFFEAILPECLTKMVGIEKPVDQFDPTLKHFVADKRYFLDINSIQMEYASAEDIRAINNNHLKTPTFEDNDTDIPDYFNATIQQSSTHSKTQTYETGEETRVNTFHPGSANSADSAKAKRRKTKKKRKRRVDPSYDIDSSHDEFHLTLPMNNNCSTSEPMSGPFAANGIVQRPRQVSENSLIDTTIVEQQDQVVRHVQLPMEAITPTVNSADMVMGSLEMIVISDSCDMAVQTG